LWFDEELGSKTTHGRLSHRDQRLWFDEELGSKTTAKELNDGLNSCGLMKNWDLRQLEVVVVNDGIVVV